MADNTHEIDEAPQLKPINVFETKETIINKTKADYTISQSGLKTIQQHSNDPPQQQSDNEEQQHQRTAQYYLHYKLDIQYSKCIKLSSNACSTVLANTTVEEYRSDEMQFKFLFCKQCNLLIGAKYAVVNAVSGNDSSYNNSNSSSKDGLACSCRKEMKYMLLKKKIKIKQSKELLCNVIGLKQELLFTVKDNMNVIINEHIHEHDTSMLYPSIKWVINKETKSSLNEYVPKKSQNDINIIIHKVEGRLFLLGKNGYYNALINNLNTKYHHNVYFVLVIKEIEDDNKEESFTQILNDLICKGGQEQLGYYREHNKILCVNDFNLEHDVQGIAKVFKRLLHSRYETTTTTSMNHVEHCKEENVDKDKELLKTIVGYEINGGNNIFSKCNMI